VFTCNINPPPPSKKQKAKICPNARLTSSSDPVSPGVACALGSLSTPISCPLFSSSQCLSAAPAAYRTHRPTLKISQSKLPSPAQCTYSKIISQADGCPPCVNGDIAIQWEWSNFDPSQNPNPLTDYDKTSHNWLHPWDEHVTQNLCQSTIRERLGKYVKYKALSFFYSEFISRTRLLKWSVGGFSRTMAQTTCKHERKCLLGICTMADHI